MIGDASKKRLFAAALDLPLAAMPGLFVGRFIPFPSDVFLWSTVVSITLAYYLVSEGFFATTPGKALFGLCVCTADGGKPSLGACVVRTLLRLLEVNPILLGGVPAGLTIVATKTRQRLGGKLSGTFVVRKAVKEAVRNPSG